jgi:hypothetical protein
MLAKIRPTSPRGIIPMAIASLFVPRSTPRAHAAFPARPAVPTSARPDTTARTTSPRMSSMTAAPRMTWASRV